MRVIRAGHRCTCRVCAVQALPVSAVYRRMVLRNWTEQDITLLTRTARVAMIADGPVPPDIRTLEAITWRS